VAHGESCGSGRKEKAGWASWHAPQAAPNASPMRQSICQPHTPYASWHAPRRAAPRRAANRSHTPAPVALRWRLCRCRRRRRGRCHRFDRERRATRAAPSERPVAALLRRCPALDLAMAAQPVRTPLDSSSCLSPGAAPHLLARLLCHQQQHGAHEGAQAGVSLRQVRRRREAAAGATARGAGAGWRASRRARALGRRFSRSRRAPAERLEVGRACQGHSRRRRPPPPPLPLPLPSPRCFELQARAP
jgi:hypothetical protein